MATKFLEPGGDSDFGVALWPTIVNGPAVATDFVHGGHLRSIKYRAGNSDQVANRNSIIADAGGRISFYAYLNAAATGTGTSSPYPVLLNNGSDVTVITLAIDSSGVLQIRDDSNNAVGSAGTISIATGAWRRICIAWTVTSTTVNQIRVFVDGSLSISVTNGTLSTTGMSRLYIGNGGADATLDLRTSDHYVDNSTALTDPGNVWVTAKLPKANGTTNGFTTQIGSGGSGYGTGHAPQVNERALSTTNGWSMVGAGSAITEEYTIEAASVGDIDISRAALIDYVGWVYAKSLSSETASIVVGGASSNISLTSTTTMFTKVAGSAIYPAGGTDIGIVTATTLTTVSLYECGIIVAYIPGVFLPTPVPRQAINRASTY